MVRLTIDQYLDKRGITRYELAKRTDIKFQTIDRYYKNRVVRYDSYILDRICTVLECNLCDIISSLGEDYLCDICTLHPRFRNFYCNFIETGLGLCCEEACRIVLSSDGYGDFTEIGELDDEGYEFEHIKNELDKLNYQYSLTIHNDERPELYR